MNSAGLQQFLRRAYLLDTITIMNESQFREDFYVEPFKPVRLHLVSGKTVDLLRQNGVMPLRDRLMVFRKLEKDGKGAEGYDIIAFQNIERLEQLSIGKRVISKRKPS